MAKKAEGQSPEFVSVTFDLFDLPTAQHKSGLVGLLLQIESMKKRHLVAPVVEWDSEEPLTKVEIRFSQPSTIALFDDLYSAEKTEVKVKSLWKGTPEVRPSEVQEETINGKQKKVTYYFHEIVQPTLPVLRQFFQKADSSCLKLWRDMLWAIPRGNPQSRQPFEQRAVGQTCKEGLNAWQSLLKFHSGKTKNIVPTETVAGSLWLGAQATNAENISFEGRVDQNLLLHFWPLASLVYVPQAIDSDGGTEFSGYVLAIPEVADLKRFLRAYPRLLAEWSDSEQKKRGYRPAVAVVDLPAQGSLAFLESLAVLSQDKIAASELPRVISAVDFLHLMKIGNNIKTMAAGRVTSNQELLYQYERVAGRPGSKPPYLNPLFRRSLMLAFLDEQNWHEPFGKLFSEWPHNFFIQSETSPRKLPGFWKDAWRKLKEIYKKMQNDSPLNENDLIADAINRFVRNYLDMRLKKTNQAWDFKAFRKNKNTPREAAEARQDLAERLFLEFRSRKDQAFIDHFSGTFFYFAQFVTKKEYEIVANALISRSRTDDLKTLTLMALSANSWVPTTSKTKETAQ